MPHKFGAMILCAFMLAGGIASTVRAEMLAILNYETKAEDSLESLALQSRPDQRREGIAIIELDQSSADYGKILIDIPLSPDLVSHHIFYNKDLTKVYVTALAQEVMHVIDLTVFPYRLKPIPTPGCKVQEDLILSDDNATWYLTCMGSQNVIVGDAVVDVAVKTITMPGSYPHGIGLHEGIDRILVTSCVAPDMSGAGYTLEVIEASTGTYLGSVEISDSKGSAPVEVLFAPTGRLCHQHVGRHPGRRGMEVAVDRLVADLRYRCCRIATHRSLMSPTCWKTPWAPRYGIR